MKPTVIILSTKEEAQLVVSHLRDILERHKVVSVADLYDLVGLRRSYSDNKWGWTNLKKMRIRPVKKGYAINMPQVEEI